MPALTPPLRWYPAPIAMGEGKIGLPSPAAAGEGRRPRLTPANTRAMLTVRRTERVDETRNDLAGASAVGLAAIDT